VRCEGGEQRIAFEMSEQRNKVSTLSEEQVYATQQKWSERNANYQQHLSPEQQFLMNLDQPALSDDLLRAPESKWYVTIMNFI